MRTILALVLSCVALTAASEQEKKQVEKELFVDLVATKAVSGVCEMDPNFKKCVNFTKDKCAETVIKVTPDCQERLLNSMPATISEREEFNKYGIQFVTCVCGSLKPL